MVAAACRASAFGIVDLASHPRVEAADVFRQIGRLTSGRFGVRLAAEEVLELAWLAREFAGLEAVCVQVGSADARQLEAAVRAIRQSGRLVLVEVTSRDELRARAGGWGGHVDRRRQRSRRAGRNGVFVRALAGGACRGERFRSGFEVELGPTSRRGAWRRARRASFSTVRFCWRANRRSSRGMARADRSLGWQRDHGRRPGVGCGSSRLRTARLERRWPVCETPPRKEALPGRPPCGIASAGTTGSACRSAKTRRWRIELARKFVTVGGIVQAVERAISAGIAADGPRGRWRKRRPWPWRTARAFRSSRAR